MNTQGAERENALAMLTTLRQHQHNGHRSPHKPLLMLLALGRLSTTGSSRLNWSVAEQALAALIAEFGEPSKTARAQSAAYPFTRMRADGVWVLDAEVPMDLVRPLSERNFTGSLPSPLETALLASPALKERRANAGNEQLPGHRRPRRTGSRRPRPARRPERRSNARRSPAHSRRASS